MPTRLMRTRGCLPSRDRKAQANIWFQ